MAHQSHIIGRSSELTAQSALMRNGYTVLEPQTVESYDCVVVPPAGKFLKAQIKTIQIRHDRGGALVVSSKKGDGTPYAVSEVDVIVGVDGNNVYVIPNTGQGEYWANNASIAARKWQLL